MMPQFDLYDTQSNKKISSFSDIEIYCLAKLLLDAKNPADPNWNLSIVSDQMVEAMYELLMAARARADQETLNVKVNFFTKARKPILLALHTDKPLESSKLISYLRAFAEDQGNPKDFTKDINTIAANLFNALYKVEYAPESEESLEQQMANEPDVVRKTKMVTYRNQRAKYEDMADQLLPVLTYLIDDPKLTAPVHPSASSHVPATAKKTAAKDLQSRQAEFMQEERKRQQAAKPQVANVLIGLDAIINALHAVWITKDKTEFRALQNDEAVQALRDVFKALAKQQTLSYKNYEWLQAALVALEQGADPILPKIEPLSAARDPDLFLNVLKNYFVDKSQNSKVMDNWLVAIKQNPKLQAIQATMRGMKLISRDEAASKKGVHTASSSESKIMRQPPPRPAKAVTTNTVTPKLPPRPKSEEKRGAPSAQTKEVPEFVKKAEAMRLRREEEDRKKGKPKT